MQHDLAKPTTISMLAHRMLIAISLVMAVGVAGAAFARAEQQRANFVWVGRGAVVATAPVAKQVSAERGTSELLHDVPSLPAKPQAAVIGPPQLSKRVVMMEVTAYCPCTRCCGPDAQGVTASGRHVSYNDGRFVAADTSMLPFGTRLLIPGYADGQAVEVIDRGGAIKGDKLDVFFATHEQALAWGRQVLPVLIED